MPYGNNKFSFTTTSPKSRLFNFVTPRDIEDGQFFSRMGSSFEFQDTDTMGLGPYMRLIPSIALTATVIVSIALFSLMYQYSSEISDKEFICACILGLLVIGMTSACVWLLRDFSASAIIDQKQKMLWLGGGFFGRWQAISFSEMESVHIVETDKTFTDGHFQVRLKTSDADYLIYQDSLKKLAANCAQELAGKLKIPLQLQVSSK